LLINRRKRGGKGRLKLQKLKNGLANKFIVLFSILSFMWTYKKGGEASKKEGTWDAK